MNTDIRLEEWNGYKIRFVFHNNEWMAVLKDICDALGLEAKQVGRRLAGEVFFKHPLHTNGGRQEMLIVNEIGIYQTIFRSNKPEAELFQSWVYSVIKSLRQSANLEDFEVFRMLDKEHQKAAMDRLKTALNSPPKVDYIKANTIADKAVSTRHGYPKMIRKADMTPNMLQDRESVLDDTVQLMALNEKYHLGLSVSTAIYAGNEKAN